MMAQMPPVDQSAQAASNRAVGVALLVATSVGWSLAGVAVKKAQVQPVLFVFVRSLSAAAAMAMAVGIVRGPRPHLGWMALSAVLHTAVVTTFVAAMSLGTAEIGRASCRERV